jgi:hypothetical protein
MSVFTPATEYAAARPAVTRLAVKRLFGDCTGSRLAVLSPAMAALFRDQRVSDQRITFSSSPRIGAVSAADAERGVGQRSVRVLGSCPARDNLSWMHSDRHGRSPGDRRPKNRSGSAGRSGDCPAAEAPEPTGDSSDTNLFDEVVTVSPAAALHVIAMVSYLLAPAAAVIAAQLAGCAYQPVPAYSYYAAPCPPTAAADTLATPNAASPVENPSITGLAPLASRVSTPAAAGAPPAPAPSCVVAVPNYYAAGYAPYWDDGWPYYGGIGLGGFIGGRFHHDFHDHRFHGRGFRGVRHAGTFHASGHFSGGGHGGGGHGR